VAHNISLLGHFLSQFWQPFRILDFDLLYMEYISGTMLYGLLYIDNMVVDTNFTVLPGLEVTI